MQKQNIRLRVHTHARLQQKHFTSRTTTTPTTKRQPRASIGFDLPGSSQSSSPEKNAEQLSRAAASVLLYSSILSTRTSKSFLDTLLYLQKGSATSILQSAGDFYKSIAGDSIAATWQEYLLEQVLKGTDNPFARSACRGDDVEHFLPAVRHDLAVLQSLAITEATLSTWIQSTVTSLPPTWSTATQTTLKRSNDTDTDTVELDIDVLIPATPPRTTLPPLPPHHRQFLRTHISNIWSWSEAAELLGRYYNAYGHGLASCHRVLTWTSGGRLAAQDVLVGAESFLSLESRQTNTGVGGEVLEEVVVGAVHKEITSTFLRLDVVGAGFMVAAPPLMLLHHAHGAAYSATMKALKKLPHIRVVILSRSLLKTSLGEVAWALAQQPRTLFAVVVPSCSDADLDGGDVDCVVMGGDGCSWPANAFFIACCSSTTTTSTGVALLQSRPRWAVLDLTSASPPHSL